MTQWSDLGKIFLIRSGSRQQSWLREVKIIICPRAKLAESAIH